MWNWSTPFSFGLAEASTKHRSTMSFYEKQTWVNYDTISHSSGKVGCVMPSLFPEDAKQYFGISEVYDIESISDVLPSLLPDSKNLYVYTTADARIHSRVQTALKTLDNRSIKWGFAHVFFMYRPLLPELDKIRWIKSLNEQKQLRFSSSICSNSFNELSTIPCCLFDSAFMD